MVHFSTLGALPKVPRPINTPRAQDSLKTLGSKPLGVKTHGGKTRCRYQLVELRRQTNKRTWRLLFILDPDCNRLLLPYDWWWVDAPDRIPLNGPGLDTLASLRRSLEPAKVGTTGTGVLEQVLGFKRHGAVKIGGPGSHELSLLGGSWCGGWSGGAVFPTSRALSANISVQFITHDRRLLRRFNNYIRHITNLIGHHDLTDPTGRRGRHIPPRKRAGHFPGEFIAIEPGRDSSYLAFFNSRHILT